MSLLLRFQGGFGVDSYFQDTIITVPQDVAEKSGRFETDFVVNVKVPLGSMNRFLHVTCDETGNPLGNWYLDIPAVLAEWANANYPLNWELGVASDLTGSELAEQARLVELYEAMRLDALAEEAHWSNSDAPTDYELAEADHLDELYKEARLAELELDEEAPWVENMVAEATWAEDAPFSKLADWQVYLAELNEKGRLAELHEADQLSWALEAVKWEEEVRLDEWNSEFNPLRWVEEARLAELELAEEARLAEMQLELAVKDHLLEMQLAEAKWSDPDGYELAEAAYLAELAEKVRLDALEEEAHVVDSALHEASRMTEWKEEIRLANWCKEGYPLRWD